MKMEKNKRTWKKKNAIPFDTLGQNPFDYHLHYLPFYSFPEITTVIALLADF